MYEGFRDARTELLRALAKNIKPVTKFQSTGHSFNKAASGGVAAHFFDQSEVSVQHLSTEDLAQNMAGGQVSERFKSGWKDALRAMFPLTPEMWNLPRPSDLVGGLVPTPKTLGASGEWPERRGNIGWPSESDKALGAALQRNRAVKELAKARGIDMGDVF